VRRSAVRSRGLPVVVCLILWVSAPSTPVAAAADGSYRWQGVGRVVAFADVHGAYHALVDLLQAAGVIDADAHWAGGATHLVSLGDLLDRGPDSRRVLDLLIRLETEAKAAGGRVHLVLGNHEVMNLTGDLRYVSDAEFAAFAEAESTEVPAGFGAHRRAFSPTGPYGRWLVDKPVLIVVNDTAFVHGGVPAVVPGRGVEGLNGAFTAALTTLLETGDRARREGLVAADEDLLAAGERLAADPRSADMPVADLVRAAADPLFGESGPLWYRGTAQCHALIEGDRLEAALARLGVRRVVLGHTPTPDRRVSSRFEGRVILLDTGMLESVYRGRPSALVTTDGVDRVVVAGGGRTDDGAPGANADDESRVEPLREVPDDVEVVRGREAAAVAIDRLLGLGFVDAQPVAGTSGEGSQDHWISERERVEQNRFRPNPCEVGSDYLLMSAFDALIGNRGRSADNLGYDRRTWALRLRDHSRAFGRDRLPSTASPPKLPRRLRDRLMDLNARVLDDAVGDVLGKREISALLGRRDEIVKNWPVLE